MASNQENQHSKNALNRLVAGKVTPHKNTDQEVVITSEKNLRLLLIEYQNSLKPRYEWKTPIGVLISLIPTIAAAETFHDAFSIPAAGWEPILRFIVYLSVIWLAVVLIKISKTWEMGNIDELINRLKEPDNSPRAKRGTLFAIKGRVSEIFGRG